MTVAQTIAKVSASLPPAKQREVLRFAKGLKAENGEHAKRPRRALTAAERKRLHPAIRAIAGMWKDRTDLPADGAAASRFLRKRMMQRGSHA